jgi:hypothetical protein
MGGRGWASGAACFSVVSSGAAVADKVLWKTREDRRVAWLVKALAVRWLHITRAMVVKIVFGNLM